MKRSVLDLGLWFRERVPCLLALDPELFRLGRTLAFELLDPPAETWTLVLRGDTPHCRVGGGPDADLTLTLTRQDLAAVLVDPRAGRDLLAAGRIRARGHFGVIAHLPHILALLGAPELPGGLGQLLGPEEAGAFRREHWPGRWFVSHDLLERWAALSELPALRSVQALLAAWPSQVRLADEYGGRLVDATEALDSYQRGLHLAFGDVEDVVPELGACLARLRWELDLPMSTHARCHVYATPTGAGAGAHFDQNANLVLQLGGRKDWHLASDPKIELPTERYAETFPAVPADLALLLPSGQRPAMPAEAELVPLAPGSFLFVPRGVWHRTVAREDSLSLNFTFDQPTWADVALPALRRRLVASPKWRAFASGAGGARTEAEDAAREALQALLRGLCDDLQSLDAGEALALLRPTTSAD